jgi:hypothetical protein
MTSTENYEAAIIETMKAYAVTRQTAEEILRNQAMARAADPDGSKARAAFAARLAPAQATYDAAFDAARAAGKGFAASDKAARKACEAAHGPFLADKINRR